MSAAKLGEALVAAQKAMPAVHKDGTNPHFRSAFVTLDNLINTTRPVLNENGLSIQQLPTTLENGAPGLRTRLTHVSGEFIEDVMPLMVDKANMQGYGSALTYAKRYAWGAVLGVSTDADDDGNAASAGADASGGPVDTGQPAPTQFRAPSVKAPTKKQVDAVRAAGDELIEKYEVKPEALAASTGSALPWPDCLSSIDPVAFKEFAGKVERRLTTARETA